MLRQSYVAKGVPGESKLSGKCVAETGYTPLAMPAKDEKCWDMLYETDGEALCPAFDWRQEHSSKRIKIVVKSAGL